MVLKNHLEDLFEINVEISFIDIIYLKLSKLFFY